MTGPPRTLAKELRLPVRLIKIVGMRRHFSYNTYRSLP